MLQEPQNNQSNRFYGKLCGPQRLILAAATTGLAVLLWSANRPQDPSEGVESVRALVSEWVDVRRRIAEEQERWKLNRELLVDRIALKKSEIADMKERIASMEVDIAKVTTDMQSRSSEHEELSTTTNLLKNFVATIEQRVSGLLPLLPEPLSLTLQPISQKLPTPATVDSIALGERFLTALGVLNGTEKFNRQISTLSEVRQLPDGTSAEVATLYLGLGAAYFANVGGTAGGVGKVGKTAWEWKSHSEVAKAVQEAIAIFRNDQSARYVALPASID